MKKDNHSERKKREMKGSFSNIKTASKNDWAQKLWKKYCELYPEDPDVILYRKRK